MPMRRRAIVLVLLILAAGLIAWRAAQEGPAAPLASSFPGELARLKVTVATAPPASIAVRAPYDPFDRDPIIESITDPFKVVSFLPAAPVVAVAPLPPPVPVQVVVTAPVAPPFPYRYFGHMSDTSGKVVTYLTRDNAIISIQAGGILDNVYRVDSVTDGRAVFTYLPLNEKFEIGASSAPK